MLRNCLRLAVLSVLLVALVTPFALAQNEWQQPKPYPKDAKAFPYANDPPQGGLNTHREDMRNTTFIAIAGGLGLALLFGVGKMIYDVKKTQPVAHIRQPWEGR